MNAFSYWVGVILAISAGSLNHFGVVLQKKVINELPNDEKFLRTLIKSPLWALGLVMGLLFGAILFLLAQVLIGPALIPGLMASGLIILAVGSVKIVGEKLKKEEIMAIIIMIVAIFLLGLSELSINISETNLLEIGFIIRTTVFTAFLVVFALFCELYQRKAIRFKGILLAVLSGFMYSLSNFWVSILMGVISHVFSGVFVIGELIYFILSSIILILVNTIGITKIQHSFKVGQASNMMPIQQVPQQLSPVFIYLLVFLLIPPNILSIIYLFFGISLILISSFLLGKRQAQIEKI